MSAVSLAAMVGRTSCDVVAWLAIWWFGTDCARRDTWEESMLVGVWVSLQICRSIILVIFQTLPSSTHAKVARTRYGQLASSWHVRTSLFLSDFFTRIVLPCAWATARHSSWISLQLLKVAPMAKSSILGPVGPVCARCWDGWNEFILAVEVGVGCDIPGEFISAW
jgi:hypothetical protein